MPSDYDLEQQGKLTHDLRHCDDPGCCTGTIMGRCRRCGEVVTVGTVCPGQPPSHDPLRPLADETTEPKGVKDR